MYVTMIQEMVFNNCCSSQIGVPSWGYYDATTAFGVDKYRKDVGMGVGGIVDGALWNRMFDPNTWLKPEPLFRAGTSTEYTNGNCTPYSGTGASGVRIQDYPGIALHNGSIDHLYIVDVNYGGVVHRAVLPMIDAMQSPDSAADINLGGFAQLGVPCGNYSAAVYGPI